MVLEDTVDTAELLRKKLLKINRHLRQVVSYGEYSEKLRLLQSIPGIGLISAITLLTEMEDILRVQEP